MSDKAFKTLLWFAASIILIITGGMLYSLTSGAIPAFKQFGFFEFLSSSEWNPTEGSEKYGALAFIIGTIITSILGILFCLPFSLPVALFIGEYFKGKKIASLLGTIVDLLAGIPSIVYGLWGFYALRPIIMSLGLSPQGFGILTASLVLGIMIIPYAASLCTSMQPPRVNKQLCGMILFWNFIQHFHKTTFPLICRQTYNLTIKIYSVLFTNSSDLIFSE